ncbi:alpha/beta hydrolase [Nonomuraea sp. NPDC050404]|uniref:alpha/beta fold hydrolase n=1 Tax=Nonomuraea sp. NPDC050404 TaxID=3155783 RepID=UPI0033E70C92
MDEIILTEDGAELWATRTTGDGVPVVFCHGGPGLWDTLGDVADLLPGAARVHRWDQRGCGRSQRVGPYSMARTAADLDAVRRHFGLDDMVLLGHSWGAQLALRYTLDHPDRVRGLVYVSGNGIEPKSAWGQDYARNLRAGLGEHLERWQELNDRERTPEEEREWAVLQWSADFTGERPLEQSERMATPWYGVNLECNAAINAADRREWGTPELRAACAELDVPVLIVDGARDIRPRRAVDSLERALPRVTRVVLERGGHLPWTEDPGGFADAAAAFLTEVGGGRRTTG